MVLCYSRRMYVEFTVSQTMEYFLACHEHAFAAFGGVPARVMVDNLKSPCSSAWPAQRRCSIRGTWTSPAMRLRPSPPATWARATRRGGSRTALATSRRTSWAGSSSIDFSAINPAAQIWLDTVANVRMHGETQRQPIELFREEEQSQLLPLNPMPYDVARILTLRASPQFRVALDTNRYSVPAEYASQRVCVKAYPDRVCIYHDNSSSPATSAATSGTRTSRTPITRRNSSPSGVTPASSACWCSSSRSRRTPRPTTKACSSAGSTPGITCARSSPSDEIYGREAVARAIDDGLAFQAFSGEYIANILESRARLLPAASPLSLTRRQDLLELDLPEPDLSLYGDVTMTKPTDPPAKGPSTPTSASSDDKPKAATPDTELLHEQLDALNLP